MNSDPAPQNKDKSPHARLRILETTDLHMQLLGYDYYRDRADKSGGLIPLSRVIEAQRDDPGCTTLLFDNGDFLQGNPLADHMVATWQAGQTHPMIAAMNALTFDAATLGNHEFNFGVPFLRSVLEGADFPIVCANIEVTNGPGLTAPFVLLDREVRCTDGQTRSLRIGVVGFVTPQITDWDQDQLAGTLETQDIVASAQATVPEIKAQGADLIIALCHSGIGATAPLERMENAAVPLANVEGVDVVLAGHIHDFFPNETPGSTPVDPQRGTLHGKPAVMAGFDGHALGVIDLSLAHGSHGWVIKDHRTELLYCHDDGPETPLQSRLTAMIKAPHEATLQKIREPIAETTQPIHSYFATFGPDLGQHLLATAQAEHIKQALPDLNHPIISVTSPFRCGGHGGVGHYIHVPPGPVLLKDAAAIYPFANVLCAALRRGADLRHWLERAASHFNQFEPGEPAKYLVNAQSPGYHCDRFTGLNYIFDLTQPARFDNTGTCINPGAQRVMELRCNGQPVQDDDIFVVAANSYRTRGGGGFAPIPASDLLYTSKATTRDVLVAHLRANGPITDAPPQPLSFAPIPGANALICAPPRAQGYLQDNIVSLGPSHDGFYDYRFTL